MNTIRFILMLSLFCLLGMFNAVDAAKVYVIGSATDLPENNKLLPVKIKVTNRPAYDAYVLVSLFSTSNMNGVCTNYPVKSEDTSGDLALLASNNTGSRWSDLGTGVLKYTLPGSYTERTHEFTVYVYCYDYGAYGKLSATLYGDIGYGVQQLDSDIGTVPRDENGNHIADSWRNDFHPYIYSNKTTEQVDVARTPAARWHHGLYCQCRCGRQCP